MLQLLEKTSYLYFLSLYLSSLLYVYSSHSVASFFLIEQELNPIKASALQTSINTSLTSCHQSGGYTCLL